MSASKQKTAPETETVVTEGETETLTAETEAMVAAVTEGVTETEGETVPETETPEGETEGETPEGPEGSAVTETDVRAIFTETEVTELKEAARGSFEADLRLGKVLSAMLSHFRVKFPDSKQRPFDDFVQTETGRAYSTLARKVQGAAVYETLSPEAQTRIASVDHAATLGKVPEGERSEYVTALAARKLLGEGETLTGEGITEAVKASHGKERPETAPQKTIDALVTKYGADPVFVMLYGSVDRVTLYAAITLGIRIGLAEKGHTEKTLTTVVGGMLPVAETEGDS